MHFRKTETYIPIFRGQVNSIMKKLVGDNPEKDFQVLNKVELDKLDLKVVGYQLSVIIYDSLKMSNKVESG